MANQDQSGYIGRTLEELKVNDEGNNTLAFVRLEMDDQKREYTLALCWSPVLFMMGMPDFLRKEIVELLRKHAALLESGEMDKRMTELGPKVNPDLYHQA